LAFLINSLWLVIEHTCSCCLYVGESLSQCDDLHTILILSIFCAVDIKLLIPTNCTYGNKYTLCHSQNITHVFWLYLVIYKEDSVTKEIICCCRYIYMIVKYEAYISAGNYNQIVQKLIKIDVWWCIYTYNS